MKSLGRALHYVQDKSVSKGFLGLSHNSREKNLSFQTPSEDVIEKGIDIAICSPHYVKKTIKSVKGRKNLDEIMDQACMCSATIAKAVIGEKTPSNELVENFKSAKERYRKRTIPIAIGTFGVILAVSIVMQNFLYIIFGVLAGYIIQKLDFLRPLIVVAYKQVDIRLRVALLKFSGRLDFACPPYVIRNIAVVQYK